MSVMEDHYRHAAKVAEAQRDEVKVSLDKALAQLGHAAAVTKLELDPTEHTRLVTAADTARAKELAAVEAVRIRHWTIRFVAVVVGLGWLAAILGGLP